MEKQSPSSSWASWAIFEDNQARQTESEASSGLFLASPGRGQQSSSQQSAVTATLSTLSRTSTRNWPSHKWLPERWESRSVEPCKLSLVKRIEPENQAAAAGFLRLRGGCTCVKHRRCLRCRSMMYSRCHASDKYCDKFDLTPFLRSSTQV